MLWSLIAIVVLVVAAVGHVCNMRADEPLSRVKVFWPPIACLAVTWMMVLTMGGSFPVFRWVLLAFAVGATVFAVLLLYGPFKEIGGRGADRAYDHGDHSSKGE